MPPPEPLPAPALDSHCHLEMIGARSPRWCGGPGGGHRPGRHDRHDLATSTWAVQAAYRQSRRVRGGHGPPQRDRRGGVHPGAAGGGAWPRSRSWRCCARVRAIGGPGWTLPGVRQPVRAAGLDPRAHRDRQHAGRALPVIHDRDDAPGTCWTCSDQGPAGEGDLPLLLRGRGDRQTLRRAGYVRELHRRRSAFGDAGARCGGSAAARWSCCWSDQRSDPHPSPYRGRPTRPRLPPTPCARSPTSADRRRRPVRAAHRDRFGAVRPLVAAPLPAAGLLGPARIGGSRGGSGVRPSQRSARPSSSTRARSGGSWRLARLGPADRGGGGSRVRRRSPSACSPPPGGWSGGGRTRCWLRTAAHRRRPAPDLASPLAVVTTDASGSRPPTSRSARCTNLPDPPPSLVGEPSVLAADLPYNWPCRGSLHLLAASVARAHLVMVQAEVADRMTAPAGQPRLACRRSSSPGSRPHAGPGRCRAACSGRCRTWTPGWSPSPAARRPSRRCRGRRCSRWWMRRSRSGARRCARRSPAGRAARTRPSRVLRGAGVDPGARGESLTVAEFTRIAQRGKCRKPS